LPLLFNFTEQELKIQPSLNSGLIPVHLAAEIGLGLGAGAAGQQPDSQQVTSSTEAEKQDEAMAQPSGSS